MMELNDAFNFCMRHANTMTYYLYEYSKLVDKYGLLTYGDKWTAWIKCINYIDSELKLVPPSDVTNEFEDVAFIVQESTIFADCDTVYEHLYNLVDARLNVMKYEIQSQLLQNTSKTYNENFKTIEQAIMDNLLLVNTYKISILQNLLTYKLSYDFKTLIKKYEESKLSPFSNNLFTHNITLYDKAKYAPVLEKIKIKLLHIEEYERPKIDVCTLQTLTAIQDLTKVKTSSKPLPVFMPNLKMHTRYYLERMLEESSMSAGCGLSKKVIDKLDTITALPCTPVKDKPLDDEDFVCFNSVDAVRVNTNPMSAADLRVLELHNEIIIKKLSEPMPNVIVYEKEVIENHVMLDTMLKTFGEEIARYRDAANTYTVDGITKLLSPKYLVKGFVCKAFIRIHSDKLEKLIIQRRIVPLMAEEYKSIYYSIAMNNANKVQSLLKKIVKFDRLAPDFIQMNADLKANVLHEERHIRTIVKYLERQLTGQKDFEALKLEFF